MTEIFQAYLHRDADLRMLTLADMRSLAPENFDELIALRRFPDTWSMTNGMLEIMDRHHPVTRAHIVDVAQKTRDFYRFYAMGEKCYDERIEDDLGYAAYQHDIGKAFVDPNILGRRNGTILTPEQYRWLIAHGWFGVQIIRALGFPERYARVAQEHDIGMHTPNISSNSELLNRHWYTPFVSVADSISATVDPNRPYSLTGRISYLNSFSSKFDDVILPRVLLPAYQMLMTSLNIPWFHH